MADLDLRGNTLVVKDIKVNADAPGDAGTSLSATELTFLDGVSAGTVTASKAVVVGSSKEILGLNTITSASTTHLALNSTSDDKQVRVNSRNFTQASGDSIGMQVTPNQTVTTTGEVFGAQFKPRAAANVDAATVNGIGIDSEVKSGTGALSSDLRGINMYLGATGSGTIGGDVVGLRARVESNINPTGNIVLMKPINHEGSQGWDGLIKFDAALGTHSMTTNSDKTGSTKSGTIKVRGSDGTLYHIQLYADS